MYNLLFALVILLLVSCSTSNKNHHHKAPDKKHHNHHHDNHHHKHGGFQHHMVINHDYIEYGDHILVIIKHRPHLSNKERKKIKKWSHNHYRHHNKPVKFKFIVSG